jgi:hypothetical protein
MASSTSTPTPPDALNEDEETAADIPMTMAASVILENLPKDAHAALETAGELRDANGGLKGKGMVIRRVYFHHRCFLECTDAHMVYS